ncbi:MAG: radical SAM protein, partial [Nitrospirae bacterium]
MRIALASTYDLGRQPFGLAEAAAWLRRAGHEVAAVDLSREPRGEARLAAAEVVGFHLPMHTATRLALAVARRLRAARPGLPLLFYG